MTFNEKLAMRIKDELYYTGKAQRVIQFEEHADTQYDMIKAAQKMGLKVIRKGAYTITVTLA